MYVLDMGAKQGSSPIMVHGTSTWSSRTLNGVGPCKIFAMQGLKQHLGSSQSFTHASTLAATCRGDRLFNIGFQYMGLRVLGDQSQWWTGESEAKGSFDVPLKHGYMMM